MIPQAQAVSNYERALQRLDDQLSKDPGDVRDICKTRLLTHGYKTPQVIVLFHGLTNCPEQMHRLADYFYQEGSNVMLVRIPHHGNKNRLTEDLKNLTAEELVSTSDQAIDIATGLGDKVIVAGSSLGAVVTGWVAQNRGVYKAVLISPNFGIDHLTVLTKPVTSLLLLAPNLFLWWDPKLKANIAGADYFYPRYSTKALGQIMRLGFSLRSVANHNEPQTKLITVVTNGNDSAVDNKLTDKLVANWIANGVGVKTFEFTKDLKLSHDLIDPDNMGQVKIVYPVLEQLIAQ